MVHIASGPCEGEVEREKRPELMRLASTTSVNILSPTMINSESLIDWVSALDNGEDTGSVSSSDCEFLPGVQDSDAGNEEKYVRIPFIHA